MTDILPNPILQFTHYLIRLQFNWKFSSNCFDLLTKTELSIWFCSLVHTALAIGKLPKHVVKVEILWKSKIILKDDHILGLLLIFLYNVKNLTDSKVWSFLRSWLGPGWTQSLRGPTRIPPSGQIIHHNFTNSFKKIVK